MDIVCNMCTPGETEFYAVLMRCSLANFQLENNMDELGRATAMTSTAFTAQQPISRQVTFSEGRPDLQYRPSAHRIASRQCPEIVMGHDKTGHALKDWSDQCVKQASDTAYRVKRIFAQVEYC